MTKIPNEVIQKLGLQKCEFTIGDSFSKGALVYFMPSLSTGELKVYLAECDMKGEIDKFNLVNIFIRTSQLKHSKISLDIIECDFAFEVLQAILINSINEMSTEKAADKIMETFECDNAVREAQKILNNL